MLLHNCRRLGRCFSGILRDGRCRSANDDCGNGCFSGSSCTNTILLLCIATGRLDTYNNRYFVNLSRMSFRVSFRFLSNRINNTRIRQHFFQYQTQGRNNKYLQRGWGFDRQSTTNVSTSMQLLWTITIHYCSKSLVSMRTFIRCHLTIDICRLSIK